MHTFTTALNSQPPPDQKPPSCSWTYYTPAHSFYRCFSELWLYRTHSHESWRWEQ
jgi:hypothetical protein